MARPALSVDALPKLAWVSGLLFVCCRGAVGKSAEDVVLRRAGTVTAHASRITGAIRGGGVIAKWGQAFASRRQRVIAHICCPMTRVEQLEQQIIQLDPEEFAQLREWLMEQDWSEWDRQIERDAASGKLDRLVKQALTDHAAGKSRPL